jgi:hypothetical protein
MMKTSIHQPKRGLVHCGTHKEGIMNIRPVFEVVFLPTVNFNEAFDFIPLCWCRNTEWLVDYPIRFLARLILFKEWHQ